MRNLYLLATLFAFYGCASITTGQDQVVSVETPGCPAASCRLTNKDGTFFVASTPGTVSVNRACGKLTIECSLDGHPDSVLTVSSSVKAMAFGNIIFGGLIGAGVDTATGAACQYPSLIPVPMDCGAEVKEGGVAAEIDQEILDMAAELKCVDLVHAGTASDGTEVYNAKCEEADSLLTCGEKGCSVSEVEIGAGAAESDEG